MESQTHLDRLQAEVNLVLEHIGKVFVAVNRNPTVQPTAQVARLKQLIPDATDRFHHALDELSHEIQLAQAVMRRDLVVCREKAGTHVSSKIQAQNDDALAAEAAAKDSKQELAASTKEVDVLDSADVDMKDSQPSSDVPNDVLTTSGEEKTSDKIDSSSTTESTKPSDTAKPPNGALHIDIKPNTNPEEDRPPNTATTNNADLDSLFGGPMSTSGEAADFNFDQPDTAAADAAQDFNFDSFSANFDPANGGENNDNISSLLPGLEDYANTQPSGTDIDLDALLGGGENDGTDQQQQQQNQTSNAAPFADFMDLGDFDASGTMNGDGENEGDLDFDALFS